MTLVSGAAVGLPVRFDAALAGYLDRCLDRRPAAGEPDWPAGVPRDVVAEIREFALAGGKRLRPAFCYWGWRGAGRDDAEEVVTAAAALELFHAFALVHDDIMDGSERRRGRPSLHRMFADLHARRGWRGDPDAFGRSVALLCGDLCAAWAEQMFHDCGLPPAPVRAGYRVFARMRTEVIAGQYLDLLSGAGSGSVAQALTVIRLKAARYTVTRPLQVGAALAGAGPELAAAYRAFGDPLGDAFQLRDDVLGVFGDPAQTGKPVLDDLREAKPTVLLSLTREAADARQAAVLARLVGDPALDEAGAAEVRAVMTATGAVARVESLLAERFATALAALEQAPVPEETRAALLELAAATVTRVR